MSISIAGSKLTRLFREARRPLLMPYATGGFPDPDSCLEIVRTYLEVGADIVELGIPFSDPLADGPVIQASSRWALDRGVRPDGVLEIAARAAALGAPIVLLCYLNNILAAGPERFFERASASGVLGVVIPDLPVEEADELQTVARANGVDVILLAAPTSTPERLKRIGAAASGFVYCVSVTGVTGTRDQVRADLPAFMARLRRHTSLPLAVGFGVSTAEQAGMIAREADGVIIGSHLVAMVQDRGASPEVLEEIRIFLQEVKRAMEASTRK